MDMRPLIKETYRAMIEGAEGTQMFRHAYMEKDGVTIDIVRNGELSCALFVSSVLMLFRSLNTIHGTVSGTIKDLESHGWKQVDTPEVGDVLVWKTQVDEKGEEHAHIGFYLGNDTAMSNSATKGCPEKHHYTYGITNGVPTRPVVAIYRGELKI